MIFCRRERVIQEAGDTAGAAELEPDPTMPKRYRCYHAVFRRATTMLCCAVLW